VSACGRTGCARSAGIRFASRYGFRIDERTRAAIEASAPYLKRLSAERVKQEIEKTTEQVACPGAAFALWRDVGALAELVPALAGIGEVQLAALDALPQPRAAGNSPRRMLRLMALFSAAEPGTLHRRCANCASPTPTAAGSPTRWSAGTGWTGR
jgi:tRNA nucleotidyltransferase/poly(A) polymerase